MSRKNYGRSNHTYEINFHKMSPKKTYTVLSVGFFIVFLLLLPFDVSATCIALAVYLVIMGLVFLTHKVGYALEEEAKNIDRGYVDYVAEYEKLHSSEKGSSDILHDDNPNGQR